jgi:hypothetical protein
VKISHKALEQCRLSPKAWVQSSKVGGSGGRFGYNQALNYSIAELHRTDSYREAVKKLEGYIESSEFKDTKRITQIKDQLEHYATWCQANGIVVADTGVLLSFPANSEWQLGGRISRVDITENGYRAVIFESFKSQSLAQLRMPLIQEAIAQRYGRSASVVAVGFHNLDGNLTIEKLFTPGIREAAVIEFQELGNRVKKYWEA